MRRDPRSLFELRRLAYRSRRSEAARAVLLDAVLETFPREFDLLVKKGKKQMQAAARRWDLSSDRPNLQWRSATGRRYGGERPTEKDGSTYFERTIFLKPSTFELVRKISSLYKDVTSGGMHERFYSPRAAASEYLRATPERKAVLFKQENMPLILRSGRWTRDDTKGWREGHAPIPIFTFRLTSKSPP